MRNYTPLVIKSRTAYWGEMGSAIAGALMLGITISLLPPKWFKMLVGFLIISFIINEALVFSKTHKENKG